MLKITFLIMGFPINSSQFLSQFAQILHPIRYSNHFPTIHSPYSNRASPSIPSDLFPPLPRPPWYHPWLSQRLSHTRTSSQKNYGHPWLYMSDFPSFCDVCLQMFTGLKPKSIHHCRNTFRSSNVASWNIRHFVPATFDTGYPRPGILSHDGRREPWTILDPRF